MTEAVLIAYIDIAVDDLALITVALPLQVIVATTYSQSDVPSAEGVAYPAIAQPTTQLYRAVYHLIGIGVMGQCPPGSHRLKLDAPFVFIAKGVLPLKIRCSNHPRHQISF